MILSIGKAKTYSDADYVLNIQNRNNRMTEHFFNDCKKYFMRSYKALFTKDAIRDDIFQQSFVKLWTEIETRRIYTSDEGAVMRIDRRGNARMLTCNLKSFLIDIAKNDYREWLRKDRLTLEDDFEAFAYMMEVKSAVRPYETEENLQEQIVASCMLELPARCKEILTMFYYKGMTLDEILVARGEKHTSKNGLKTGKHKCMESLKSKVRDMCHHHGLKY